METNFNPARLIARIFPEVRQKYDYRDVSLYALSLGLGADPLDERQLRYVYEGTSNRGPLVVPTFANVLAYPGFWACEPDTGIDWRRLVHAEQEIALHLPVPPSGSMIGRNCVSALWDRGSEKGAFLQQRREIFDEPSGAHIATVTQLSLLRGNGGFDKTVSEGAPPLPHPIPDRAPDATFDLRSMPQAALFYRLLGDANPLHADPEVARSAGFERPILHGMATMGIAALSVISAVLNFDPSRFAGMRVRFTAPAYPGETFRTLMWVDGDVISLRTIAMERDIIVLDHACVKIR